MKQIQKRAIRVFLIFGILFLAIGFFISNLLSIRIARQIIKISDEMSAIGTGEADLTKRLKIKTKDEIGILSSGFNIFVDTLQKLAKKTTDASANLFQQAQVLSSILEEVTSLSDEINASVQQVAQDSSKQLQDIEEILKLAKATQTSVEETVKIWERNDKSCPSQLEISVLNFIDK